MLVRKVCLVGVFAVGKTSLATRFLSNAFPGTYLPTVGVRVGSRELDLPDSSRAKLVVWDIAGADDLTTLSSTYLKGASGLVLVADGTRLPTYRAALKLQQQCQTVVGNVPAVILINKQDLPDEQEVSVDDIRQIRESGVQVFLTSAKTGDGVLAAFTALAGVLGKS